MSPIPCVIQCPFDKKIIHINKYQKVLTSGGEASVEESAAMSSEDACQKCACGWAVFLAGCVCEAVERRCSKGMIILELPEGGILRDSRINLEVSELFWEQTA